MQKSKIQFSVEPEVKAEAEKLFANLGLDMPSALRIFLAKCLNVRGIPFPVNESDCYSQESLSDLERRAADINAGKHCVIHDIIED